MSRDRYLDELFKKARNQSPEASIKETISRFTETITAVGGETALRSWVSKYFSVNGVVFLIGTLIITALVLSIPNGPEFQNPDRTELEILPADTVKSRIIQTSPPTTLSPSKAITTERTAQIDSNDHTSLSNVSEQLTTDSNKTHRRGFSISLPKETKPISPEMTISQTPEVSNLKDTKVLFTLTERSSESEFERISTLARQAGIQYHCHIHGLKNRKFGELPFIRGFTLDLTIDGTSTASRIHVKVPKRGKFEVTFGWFVNGEGKATVLTDIINITKATKNHTKP